MFIFGVKLHHSGRRFTTQCYLFAPYDANKCESDIRYHIIFSCECDERINTVQVSEALKYCVCVCVCACVCADYTWLFLRYQAVFSPSQPQPDSASATPCARILYLECFHVCFSCAVSLIKMIINYCYWQFGWILFHSRNIHINALAEAEPDILGILWFSLSQNMKCLYFLNETIPSQINSSNSWLWF